METLPEIPAIAEFVPEYEVITIGGLGAHREANVALADPKLKPRLAEFGVAPLSGSPSELANLIVAETEKWAKVVKFANIKPE